MAAARRRALLLLRFILSLCCSGGFVAHGLKQGANANLHPPPPVVVVPVNRQLKLGASNIGGAAAAAVSGARRAGGWRLAEEEACRGDVSRMCPKHTWSNNLAVLECLQDRKEVRHTWATVYPPALACSPPCGVSYQVSVINSFIYS